MPGGSLVATAPVDAELEATRAAVEAAGLGSVRTFKATAAAWAPGLPAAACDAIYSRMVIHMIPEDVVHAYIPLWRASLKPTGRMLMADHNPMDGGTTGPRRPMMTLLGLIPLMQVVPADTEVEEITSLGPFTLAEGPFDHPFFMGGYGAVYTRVE